MFLSTNWFTSNGLTYDSPVNPNAKTTVIHDDSKDEVEEAEKEVEPSSSKQTKSDPPPLKAYKLKISYPQRLRKEKMEERYTKFIDLIKEVRINVPLIDVLAGMPNYEKFFKDLVSNKSKMEQISAAFLNEECFVIVRNKLPPKLGDPGSFLIPCTIAGSVEYLTLADLGASINLMPYSLYVSLSENTLKPTRMITEEELDALLDDSKLFSTTSEKISESSLDHEFKEFMAIKIEEILEQEEEVEDNFEELPLEENLRIKNSIQDPPTGLFDIEIKNKKGLVNVTADHSSRLENPHLEELRDDDIDDNFPDETLVNVSLTEEDKIPWGQQVGKILRILQNHKPFLES
ncbi:hypothetical protein Tco_0597671 [Tanacetum coccineum]